MADSSTADPRIAALPDIHGHAKGEHKAFAEERPIPYTARMLFLWFFHAARRSSPRFVMVADHMNYLTFEDPAAVNLVRRALKLAQAGDLYGAAETAGVELGHAAVVSEGLRRGMRYSIGAEIDNDPRCRPDAQNIVDAMKPDGMIRSVHFLPITHPQHGENWMWAFDNPEFADLYDVVGTDNVWELYMATLLDAIEKLPGHIVGHFYVPAKFGHWPADETLESYEDRFVAACAERGMAIEVNSRYLYKYYVDDDAQRTKYRAAHLRLLRKAKAAGVMVAVGSDAHSPKDQGGAFDAVLALLDEADINEIAFPIAGRLARVALRATEEIIREHAAALAAPVERAATRGVATLEGDGDDDDTDETGAPADATHESSGVLIAIAPPDAATGDAPVATPALPDSPPAAAPVSDSAIARSEAPRPKKRSAKASPVSTVVDAAHAVAETVVTLAEQAVKTVATALEKDATPVAATAVATGALATGALATVVATREARSHAATVRKAERPTPRRAASPADDDTSAAAATPSAASERVAPVGRKAPAKHDAGGRDALAHDGVREDAAAPAVPPASRPTPVRSDASSRTGRGKTTAEPTVKTRTTGASAKERPDVVRTAAAEKPASATKAGTKRAKAQATKAPAATTRTLATKTPAAAKSGSRTAAKPGVPAKPGAAKSGATKPSAAKASTAKSATTAPRATTKAARPTTKSTAKASQTRGATKAASRSAAPAKSKATKKARPTAAKSPVRKAAATGRPPAKPSAAAKATASRPAAKATAKKSASKKPLAKKNRSRR
ncbi:MAG: hypothetical protein NVS3B17_07400 [Vulcanimicrobiaceae bacterium]